MVLIKVIKMTEDYRKYQEQVFDYLEYLGFDELVEEYEPADIAKSLSGAIWKMYVAGISPRLNAICNWSFAMNYQIIPQAKEKVKH